MNDDEPKVVRGGDAGIISTEGSNFGSQQASHDPSSKKIATLRKLVDMIDRGDAFDAGDYAKEMIPPGEYAFIALSSDAKYYSEEDLSGNIIDNENFDSFGWVYVHGVGNIKTHGVLVKHEDFSILGVESAKELYLVLNDLDKDYNQSGYYRVGVDIAQGSYVLTSIGNGYASINSGPVGSHEIIDNESFSGTYRVMLYNGQYLKLSRAVYDLQD